MNTFRIARLSALGLLAVFASQAFASGYKMEFQSASVLADAGEAAVVEDAGTNWYNSAGLVYLPLQIVMSAIDVYAPTTFHGTVNAPSTLNQLGAPFDMFASNYSASGTASSHPNSALPAFHLSAPMSDTVALGLSVVPAWGFTEDYGESSMLRYNLTRVYTKTLDIAPSIAWKLNSQWSLGIGPDIHYFSVQSKTHVRTESINPAVVPTLGDSISRFSANDWNYGGHIGLLFKYSDTTRIGLNYRSKLVMHLNGYSAFGLDQGGFNETNLFQLPLPLPATTSLSIYHDFTPCWALMGTVAYDQWSSIQNYHAKNYIQPPTPDNPSGILPDVTQPQKMHNTFDLSIGTHYKLTENFMLRGSFKYEPTPTSDSYRYVNFPDGVKYGFQIGSRYQASKKIAIDLIYGHVFVKSAHINDVNPVTGAVASGHSNTSINLLGGQLVWNL
ncbi:Long-chain fatty acid transport protein [Aquicella siphonis]|uniref:Long-chain fatty acid transport protein n=1 Tax=Aquicella siphonis TaxID=254247 RepID=A0A5E4PG47_9COXI|nr:outer membrane protein transport protein [Aquicella siphonis]VVC75899.1 Long-chain fatty acid transport protein [Aquicella siphonis]